MCFYNNVDPVEFEESRTCTARKEHRCQACGATIQRGEKYVRCSGKFDGEFYRSAFCGACELTRYRLHLHELGEGCKSYESWCPMRDLVEWCNEPIFDVDTDDELGVQMEMSTRAEGQRWLEIEPRRMAQLTTAN